MSFGVCKEKSNQVLIKNAVASKKVKWHILPNVKRKLDGSGKIEIF